MNRDESARLLSLAVHEFRTPVTVVAGYLRMLLKMQPGPADQPRKLIEEAEKSCTRLAALIAELSEISNLTAGQVPFERNEIDLFALLDEVAATVHEGADRDVRLQIERSDERALIAGDRKYLSRGLESLLTATLRERAQPGVLVVACGVQGLGAERFAYVAIAPRGGDGVPDGFRASEWAPFEEWRGGLGFRLVLARQVITAHGGQVFSGRGTEARGACAFTLPTREPAS
jgi:signal transduction histidine kinase